MNKPYRAKPKGKIELVEIPESDFADGMQVFLPYNLTSIFGVGLIKKSERPTENWKFECDKGTSYINYHIGGKPKIFYKLLVTFELDGTQHTKYLSLRQWNYAFKEGLIDGGEFDVHYDDTSIVDISGYGRQYNRDEVKKFIKEYHHDFILHTTMTKEFIKDVDEWFNEKTQKIQNNL